MDLSRLQSDIEVACEKCFSELRRKYSDEEICGYAIYSDSGAMSVSPAINTRSNLDEMCSEDPDDCIYYKWSPGEWSHESEGAELFEEISKFLRSHSSETKDGVDFDEYRSGVYEACVGALESLLKKGFFDEDENAVIVFTVPDSDEPASETKWIERLNSHDLAQEFSYWVRSL